MYLTLHLTSNDQTFYYEFDQDLINKKYEVAILQIDGKIKQIAKHYFYNIIKLNNKLRYIIDLNDESNNSIPSEIEIEIPSGKYTFNELNDKINSLLPKRDKNFLIIQKTKDDTIIFEIKKHYTIDFRAKNSIFHQDKLIESGKTEIPYIDQRIGKYTDNKMIFIKTNLIDNTFINNNKTNQLYRFELEELEEKKKNIIFKEPLNLIYHKIISKINTINISLVDIDNKMIKSNNIDLYIDLHLREIK